MLLLMQVTSNLPAMGPYDLGALRTSFSSGAFSDQDKYKVLKQFDQPQGYKFPAVTEGGQLRRLSFVNYPWLTYSKSENGGYYACCMAFASSIRTGGKFGARVESPLTKFKNALETLAGISFKNRASYAKMVVFLESASKSRSVVAQLNTNTKVATLGLCLVPSTICKKDDWQTYVNNLASLYQGDLPAPLSLQTELHCWKHKCIHIKTDDLPDSPIEALKNCDSRLFPNISTLLRIMSTIPLTPNIHSQLYIGLNLS